LRQELPGASIPSIPHPQQQQQHAPQIDPNSFSRNYLNEQIHSANPGFRPSNMPFTNGSSGAAPPQHHSNGLPIGGTSGASPRAGSDTRDVRTMEDDLRRMLKLNVLG